MLYAPTPDRLILNVSRPPGASHRPNRQYIASGLYLPSVERRGLGEIVVAVDTSGSIGRLELEQFAAEISAISEEANPEAIHVVYCDAAVQCAQQFGPSEPVRLEPKGGGGTDFR